MSASVLGTWSRRLRTWAVDDALPFWATAGLRRLQWPLRGAPCLRAAIRLPSVPIRLMVQARQIYVYATAARLGWYPRSAGLVERAFDSMVRDFQAADGQDGWVFSIDRRGTVVDARRDLYAHAFVLFAVASFVQMTGQSATLALADQTLAFIDKNMRAHREGYVERLPPTAGHRRQNPHMHLLEASWPCGAPRRTSDTSNEPGMSSTCSSRDFFQPASGTLCEYLDDELRPASGIDGAIVEPGHHYEWIWLLRWFERETGRPGRALCRRALCPCDRLWLRCRWPDRRRAAGGWKLQAAVAPRCGRSPRRSRPISRKPGSGGRVPRTGRRRSPNGSPRICCSRRPGAAGSTGSTRMASGRSTICRPARFYHIVCALHELELFTTR